jgi:titin
MTVSGSSFSATFSGLMQGTSYTFSVVANNSNGAGTASAPSNQITAITVPSAPTSVTASAADGSAILSWTAPPDGGGAIQGYVVTPYINGVAQTPITFNQPNLMEVILGLTNGVTYTFTVVAFNAAGKGPGSSPSNSVVPNASVRQPSAQGPSSAAGGRAPIVQSSPAPPPPGR